MPDFKVVNVSKDAAMNSPRNQYFNELGVSAYSCLIPQTNDTAHEVHFVDDADGTEYGQYEDEVKAKGRAAAVVRAKRRDLDDSPSP